ncbi:MAG: DNA integrity scanning diadenylate cyclase DisA [Micrococcales bacterium]|nr:DNA integrity scanning diadenylate cyclase DisA [Micrococcales bacterium]
MPDDAPTTSLSRLGSDALAETPPGPEDLLRATLVDVAPGTALRDGLDRIIRGGTGALVVLGFDEIVASICSGGFVVDVEFTAPRLRELSKMDGAVVVDQSVGRIVRAGVQLLPDPATPTTETGTRQRTAERVSRQTGFPVIAVSKSMRNVAVYAGGLRHELEDTEEIANRAKQAVATLERYRDRLDEVSHTLLALEVEDLVTVRDIAQVAQRQEMVARIAEEIDGLILELGRDGRLLHMQYEELIQGVAENRRLLIKDYSPRMAGPEQITATLLGLAGIAPPELIELESIARVLGLSKGANGLDRAVSPRGYRLISRIPRIPEPVADRLVDHFGTVQRLLAASLDELTNVEGVGEQRGRAIREGLSRIAESSILERFV